MMSKIRAIAWKEIYTTFTDRTLILIMIVTPLAISTIVGLAFGGLGSGDVPIRDIPVALLNFDEGSSFGANYGAIFTSALVPSEGESGDGTSSFGDCPWVTDDGAANTPPGGGITLFDLTDTIIFDAAAAEALINSEDSDYAVPDAEVGSPAYIEAVARQAVDNGTYVAMIVIPSGYTESVTYIPVLHPRIEAMNVTVYANSGSPVSASIIRSVVESITNQIATGNIAAAATFAQMELDYGLVATGQVAQQVDMQTVFTCAFSPALSTVGMDTQTVTGESGNVLVQILVAVGSGQAMFFALFTAQFGVLSIHDERRNWTLQRLIMSPTSRNAILTGKLIGVWVTVIFQLVLLMVALSAVASILQGQLIIIWGNNFLAIVFILLAASIAVSGLGMLLVGIIRTPEQVNTISPVINLAMAALGGSFGFALPQAVSQFSLIYWGTQAFNQIAGGAATGDIVLHLLVLVAQGAVMFGIGLVLFNRRFEMA